MRAAASDLEHVRLTVEGTQIETFSDADGQYRLTAVPAGSARIRAFHTGLEPLTGTVVVAAGQIARHDITLGGSGSDGQVVTLDAVHVASSREMNASAIAINEQRYAPNIKAVSSTDEFGGVSEGSVGKPLPARPPEDPVSFQPSPQNRILAGTGQKQPDHCPPTVNKCCFLRAPHQNKFWPRLEETAFFVYQRFTKAVS